MIEKQVYIFFNTHTQRTSPTLYVSLLQSVIKQYAYTQHQLIFLLILKQLIIQEKEKHLIYCTEYKYKACRFFKFYTNLIIYLTNDITDLSSNLENINKELYKWQEDINI